MVTLKLSLDYFESEKTGRIVIVKNGRKLRRPFLSLRGRVLITRARIERKSVSYAALVIVYIHRLGRVRRECSLQHAQPGKRRASFQFVFSGYVRVSLRRNREPG